MVLLTMVSDWSLDIPRYRLCSCISNYGYFDSVLVNEEKIEILENGVRRDRVHEDKINLY